jgi:hypothetical protein
MKASISHLDQFYLNGSCPPMKILQKVLSAFEAVPPGLQGRIRTDGNLYRSLYDETLSHVGSRSHCLGAHLSTGMCHWGPQQQCLQDLEPVMWQEGEMMRINPSMPNSSGKSSQHNNSKQQQKNNNSKKYPAVVEAVKEAVSGRPGQAEQLLPRRHRQTTTAIPKSENASKPVPVTPDTATSKKTLMDRVFVR